jgi:hypothetical protein
MLSFGFHGVMMFGHWHGLSGQRRLVDPQVGGVHQPEVRRHHVACLEEHDIARYNVACRDLPGQAVADDASEWRTHLPKRGNSALCAVFLENADGSVQHDNDDDCDRVDDIAE